MPVLAVLGGAAIDLVYLIGVEEELVFRDALRREKRGWVSWFAAWLKPCPSGLGFYEIFRFDLAVALLDVVVEDDFELVDDVVAAEGHGEFAVDVDGGVGVLEGAGERDADVGVLGLAGAVDDAAHDGELELFDAGVLLLPLGHGFDEIGLDALGELLEVGGGGAAAAGAGGDLRHEGADAERLEDLLAAADLFGAVAAGCGREARRGWCRRCLRGAAERGRRWRLRRPSCPCRLR